MELGDEPQGGVGQWAVLRTDSRREAECERTMKSVSGETTPRLRTRALRHTPTLATPAHLRARARVPQRKWRRGAARPSGERKWV